MDPSLAAAFISSCYPYDICTTDKSKQQYCASMCSPCDPCLPYSYIAGGVGSTCSPCYWPYSGTTGFPYSTDPSCFPYSMTTVPGSSNPYCWPYYSSSSSSTTSSGPDLADQLNAILNSHFLIRDIFGVNPPEFWAAWSKVPSDKNFYKLLPAKCLEKLKARLKNASPLDYYHTVSTFLFDAVDSTKDEYSALLQALDTLTNSRTLSQSEKDALTNSGVTDIKALEKTPKSTATPVVGRDNYLLSAKLVGDVAKVLTKFQEVLGDPAKVPAFRAAVGGLRFKNGKTVLDSVTVNDAGDITPHLVKYLAEVLEYPTYGTYADFSTSPFSSVKTAAAYLPSSYEPTTEEEHRLSEEHEHKFTRRAYTPYVRAYASEESTPPAMYTYKPYRPRETYYD